MHRPFHEPSPFRLNWPLSVLLFVAILAVACTDADGGGGGGGEFDGTADVQTDVLDATSDGSDASSDGSSDGSDGSDGSDAPDASEVSDGGNDGTQDSTGPDDAQADIAEVEDATTDGSSDAEGELPAGLYTYNTSCTIPADPSAGGTTISYEAAFVGANIEGPITMTHANDGSNRIFVGERDGRIKVFPKVEPTPVATTYVDFSAAVNTEGEGAFSGLAFHPNYASNGYVYTHYTSSTVTGDGQFSNVLSRWKVSDSDPNVADPNSELVLLTVAQTDFNHNSGALAFGPDGYLYMTIGDGGPQGDPSGNGQNTATLLGSVIRIDVDSPASVSQHYGIPADNPFANDETGARKEIYAWGFRNPWRLTFDRLTGSMWVSDVGQGRVEEATIVTSGTNAGWRVMEGHECYPNDSPNCDKTEIKQPEVYYYHDVDGKEGGGRSISGGYVYRGTEVPALYGAYLYADWHVPNVWAYKHGEEPMPNPNDGSDAMFLGPGQVAAFGEDAEGEVYMLKLYGGEPIWRFVQTDDEPQPTDFPQTLTETGCFSDLATLTPVDGVFEYAVNAPLWSDTAKKGRWFVLPDGGQITYDDDGAWEFPIGTVFIKHFALETQEGVANSEVRLETRFMVQEAAGQTRGYTYRWNDEGTEAHLLPSADTRDLTLTLDGAAPMPYTWRFPSRAQCATCHNSITGGPLGLETGQLNRWHAYPELSPTPINTIDALRTYGLLKDAPEEAVSELEAFPVMSNSAASNEDRARAYLHANCANCHRDEGASGVPLDLEWTTDLDDMNACGVSPLKGELGVAGAQLITPGDASASVIYLRMTTPDHGARMPPISAALVNEEAAAVVAAWINGLSGCP